MQHFQIKPIPVYPYTHRGFSQTCVCVRDLEDPSVPVFFEAESCD